MKKVYLKSGAKDEYGNRLNTMTEYTVIVETAINVVISNGYGIFKVNHEWIKGRYNLTKT